MCCFNYLKTLRWIKTAYWWFIQRHVYWYFGQILFVGWFGHNTAVDVELNWHVISISWQWYLGLDGIDLELCLLDRNDASSIQLSTYLWRPLRPLYCWITYVTHPAVWVYRNLDYVISLITVFVFVKRGFLIDSYEAFKMC